MGNLPKIVSYVAIATTIVAAAFISSPPSSLETKVNEMHTFSGDGNCDPGETNTPDCKVPLPYCGNGIVEDGETHENCPFDYGR